MNLDYCKTLELVARYMNANAKVYITSLDDTNSGTSNERNFGPGIIANILRTLSTRHSNIRSFGKGSIEGIGSKAVARLKVLGFHGRNSDVIIIGDRFDTDVRQGNQDGLYSILVETGCHHLKDRAQYPQDHPDAIVSIDQVFPFEFETRTLRSYVQNYIKDRMRSKLTQLLKYIAKEPLTIIIDQLHVPPRRIQSLPAKLCDLPSEK